MMYGSRSVLYILFGEALNHIFRSIVSDIIFPKLAKYPITEDNIPPPSTNESIYALHLGEGGVRYQVVFFLISGCWWNHISAITMFGEQCVW